MKHHHKKVRAGFFVAIILIAVLLVFSINFVKNNYYLSENYLNLNSNWLKNAFNEYFANFKNVLSGETEEELASPSVLVLSYHGVADAKKFKDEMYTLKGQGYKSITLAELENFKANNLPIGERSVLISFHEGQKNNFYNTQPVLKSIGFNAVIFIDPKNIKDDDTFYLSNEEIKHISRQSNWSVGLYADPVEEVKTPGSTLRKKDILEKVTNNEILAVSYPFGLADSTSEAYFNNSIKNSFKLIFNKYSGRNALSERANYFDSTQSEGGYGIEVKQVFVNNLGENDFEKVVSLEDLRPGYVEEFVNKVRFLSTGGEVSFLENSISLENAKNETLSVFLDRSYNLSDYDFNFSIKDVAEPKGTVISLLVKTQNTGVYTACQFSESGVEIKSRINNESRVHGTVKANIRPLVPGTVLGVRVYENIIQCLVNGNSAAIAQTDITEKNGSIGINLSNKNGLVSSVNIEALTIGQSQVPNIVSTKDGQELIYSFIDDGNIEIAQKILENVYVISRFDGVKIQKINWEENNFDDRYWRFNFYNLEPVRHLMYSWQKTGDTRLKDKAIEIVDSFAKNGKDKKYSWDLHGTAFRTMTLVNMRAKLKNNNALTEEFDRTLLALLKEHGEFLAVDSHFERFYNHGLDQSSALYVLALNYPNKELSRTWRGLAEERLNIVLNNIVDRDGVLVENSPYYHFYTLEKFWEVTNFFERNHLSITGNFNEKVNKMIAYGAYVLQPDLHVPIIGASLDRKFLLAGMYKQMANKNPEFMYVLTKGSYGKKPQNKNIAYPDSGQTIMRSGWGENTAYENETQLIMDVGKYRTNHSDLDALSFHLFGKGIALMPDAGLYTYDPGEYRNYFHGTRAHNTVVVDGKDQEEGSEDKGFGKKVTAGFFEEGDGYVYQSGEASLNDDVSHQRAITLFGKSAILIVDRLTAKKNHDYEQIFHLFPGAIIEKDGLTVSAKTQDGKQALRIKQFIVDGVSLNQAIGKEESPMDGWCSFEYTKAVPCYSLAYKQGGKEVTYVTVIDIGGSDSLAKYTEGVVTLESNGKKFNIEIQKVFGSARKVEVKNKPVMNEPEGTPLNTENLWSFLENYEVFSNPSILNTFEGKVQSLKFATDKRGYIFDAMYTHSIDLNQNTLHLKVKASEVVDLSRLDVSVSNNNWTNSATFSIKSDTYTEDYSGTWLPISVSPAELRDVRLGSWYFKSPNFDWSNVDKLKIRVASKVGESVDVEVKDLKLVPAQEKATAVIMFDDGWESVLDAAKILQKYNLKGNVAVIANSVGKRSFMTVDQLKDLQNNYGWGIANHSSLHKNGVEYYSNANDLEGYENDVLDGAQFLQINNIDSASNWYIYPNGKVDEKLKGIIGKYYPFARSTIDAPETYPFADPLGVKVFSVYSDRTTNESLLNAVKDAIKYKHTLFLMFHKFAEANPEVYTEYPIEQFEGIIKDISEQGIEVVTLPELDKMHGYEQGKFEFTNPVPDQLKLVISKE